MNDIAVQQSQQSETVMITECLIVLLFGCSMFQITSGALGAYCHPPDTLWLHLKRIEWAEKSDTCHKNAAGHFK